MANFLIKAGDTLPALVAVLADASSNPVVLTGSSVKFHMRSRTSGTVVVNATATITDATNGQVTYTWTAPDTATAGAYDGEFEVTFPSGKVETFPNDSNISIQITDQIA